MANQDKEHYMVIGDLSFFYDLNTIFNQIPDNVHILLINNGVGTEFKNYNHRAAYFGEEANDYMAAKGHNGFKNRELVKTLCESRGIKYFSASSKDEYLSNREVWLRKGNGPIILEAFADDKDESDALRLMNSIVRDESIKTRLKRSRLGRLAKKILRRG